MTTTDPRPGGPKPEPETVDTDTLVARPDLGPGCSTFVVAGDTIPRHLADHDRRDAAAPPPAAPGKSKARAEA
ncbi:hypothetical protein [Streptomyces sp. NPDC056337]|uniref:hypothetical protein n=1 Tax=Streptomyces sp. NPDC056337 TaxID=3345787 RepID=UPI0035D67E24